VKVTHAYVYGFFDDDPVLFVAEGETSENCKSKGLGVADERGWVGMGGGNMKRATEEWSARSEGVSGGPGG